MTKHTEISPQNTASFAKKLFVYVGKSPVTANIAGLCTKNTNSDPCLAPQTPPINRVQKIIGTHVSLAEDSLEKGKTWRKRVNKSLWTPTAAIQWLDRSH